MRKNSEIQAAEVTTFKHRVIARIGAIIMPCSLRSQIEQAVAAVELPLRLVTRCKSTKEKWEIYKGRVRSAILPLLDRSSEGERIMADIQRSLE